MMYPTSYRRARRSVRWSIARSERARVVRIAVSVAFVLTRPPPRECIRGECIAVACARWLRLHTTRIAPLRLLLYPLGWRAPWPLRTGESREQPFGPCSGQRDRPSGQGSGRAVRAPGRLALAHWNHAPLLAHSSRTTPRHTRHSHSSQDPTSTDILQTSL
eukprot:scaffold8219_cov58-Phaeocystis_antarctica.AAC.1